MRSTTPSNSRPASMLDVTTQPVIDRSQQDVAQPHFAPTPGGSRPVWCVVEAYARAERRAHAALHRYGFEAYLPLITVRLPNRHYHTRALFAPYLFVRLDLSRPWSPVKHAPGVFNLVSFDGTPAICPDGAVDALRALDAQRATPMPESSYWAPGMAVSLAVGTSAAVPGVVLDVRDDMAFVSTMLFGHLREISVSVDCLRARDE